MAPHSLSIGASPLQKPISTTVPAGSHLSPTSTTCCHPNTSQVAIPSRLAALELPGLALAALEMPLAVLQVLGQAQAGQAQAVLEVLGRTLAALALLGLVGGFGLQLVVVALGMEVPAAWGSPGLPASPDQLGSAFFQRWRYFLECGHEESLEQMLHWLLQQVGPSSPSGQPPLALE